jgi:hypothetical protein
MAKLTTNQDEADAAFDRWVEALVGKSTDQGDRSWVVDGTGLIFSNYGHGKPGEIQDEVMLGVDRSAGSGVVKIVRPAVAGRDKRKLTAVGRGDDGRLLLLREGWLKKNPVSNKVRERFRELSELEPEPLLVGGTPSTREWYVVADTDADPEQVVAQTVAFSNACSLARRKAGGGEGNEDVDEKKLYRLGLDEMGRVKKVRGKGGTREVEDLQGYVFQALKRILGEDLQKPGLHGYAVDGMVKPANLLVEIKTGTSPHDAYEAVGQLALYPSLISLPAGLKPILLVPDDPALRPYLAAALAKASIEVHFYSVGRIGKAPHIVFTPAFLAKCGA